MPAAKLMSEPVKEMLDGGFTVSEIARAFRMNPATVRDRVANVRPHGKREERKTYLLRDVAKYLVPVPEEQVHRVMRMNHMDLPPMLKKEYWIGQSNRLKVREQEGELWNTQSVLDYVGEAFKTIRMEIQLAADRLERETELTDRQREAVKSLMDGMMESIRANLTRIFAAKRRDPAGKPGGATEEFTTVQDAIRDL
jgi:hypothetical protein